MIDVIEKSSGAVVDAEGIDSGVPGNIYIGSALEISRGAFKIVISQSQPRTKSGTLGLEPRQQYFFKVLKTTQIFSSD